MTEENNYGKNNKRIIFTDTDHRHAQLSLKLKNDGMTQAKFFRSIISGYLSDIVLKYNGIPITVIYFDCE